MEEDFQQQQIIVVEEITNQNDWTRNQDNTIEDVEEELVWQEDGEEEYVEALEEDFQQQQISVVEEITNQNDWTRNQDNTIEDEQQYVPDVTM